MLSSELPAWSGSSYGALVSNMFVSSPVSLTLFQLPSLVRARVPSNSQAFREGIYPSLHHPSHSSRRHCVSFLPGCVTSHCVFLQSQTQFCSFWDLPFRTAQAVNLPFLSMCLKCCTFHSVGILPAPFLPPAELGGDGGAPPTQVTCALYPATLWHQFKPLKRLSSFGDSIRKPWLIWPHLKVGYYGVSTKCHWYSTRSSQSAWWKV